jgi:DNA repair protein RecN (Recombination protein N)
MLKSLHVHNFALLEDAEVEFAPGFNIFTGETGAGKSILIDAFGIVLGSRASTEYIRSGTDAFWVQAVFDVSGKQQVLEALAAQDIELADENLFLKRKLNVNGKGQCSVNGVQVPLTVLRSLSRLLVDIHGQHENQDLLEAKTPLRILDAAGGSKLAAVLAKYQEAFAAYQAAAARVQTLENSSADRELLLDRYGWEIKEITDAKLRPGEEEELQAENRRLQNGARILDDVTEAHGALDAESGALNALAGAKESLRDALRYDDKLQPLVEALDSAWITADDARQQLAVYLENAEGGEARLNAVQERLDQLYKLHKKYGATAADIAAYLAKVREEYATLQDLDARISQARQQLAKLTVQLDREAAQLTTLRQGIARQVSAAVLTHLQDLAMPDGNFTFAFAKREPGPDGADTVTFMFSANKGEPLLPLPKIASGGELSRVALALKTVLTHVSGVPTMVFDEIDAGVGGVTAQKMAEKLALIARRAQVLCITHLPQIAAFADRHLYIQKETAGERTVTRIAALTGADQVREIMRMSGGENASKAAMGSAKELLAAARKFKDQKTNLFMTPQA